MPKLSEITLKKLRDYVIEEPSYTVAFAAWEMGMKQSISMLYICNEELLRLGIVREIEPRSGPNAAVYAYVPPQDKGVVRRIFPELDEARVASDLAQASGAPIPYTGQPKGPSGKATRTSAHRVRRPKTKGRS